MQLTIESIVMLEPCDIYLEDDAELLEELFGDRLRVSHRVALQDERVPLLDRIWLGVRLLCPHRQRRFAQDCGERTPNANPDVVANRVDGWIRAWGYSEAALWTASRAVAEIADQRADEITWEEAQTAEQKWQVMHLIHLIDEEER